MAEGAEGSGGGGRPVRLADVADRLGLTTVAVSKALRDLPDISERTRALVKDTAAEMGYIPNYFARTLQASRSNLLGVVIPRIRHPFFAEAIAGIQRAAAASGHEMLLAVSDEDAAVERRHIETFLAMRPAGLLVSAVDDPATALADAALRARARKLGVPILLFDRVPEGAADLPAIAMEDREGGRAAVARAIARGYRDIAHVAAGAHLNIGRERTAGYHQALADHGLARRPEWVVTTGVDERAGYEAFRRIWACRERPDAVLFATSPQLAGGLDAMRALGIAPGERPLTIFFGLPETVRFHGHRFVCAAQPALAIGEQAVATVLAPTAEQRSVRLALRIVDDTDPLMPAY